MSIIGSGGYVDFASMFLEHLQQKKTGERLTRTQQNLHVDLMEFEPA